MFVGHWICDFVHSFFIYNNSGLFLATLFFFLLLWLQERRPRHRRQQADRLRCVAASSLVFLLSSRLFHSLSLSLSLSHRFDLLLWFLSLSFALFNLISSLAQLLSSLCGLWLLSECLCAFLFSLNVFVPFLVLSKVNSLRLYLLVELVVKFWSIFIWLVNSASKLQLVWVCDSVVEIIF